MSLIPGIGGPKGFPAGRGRAAAGFGAGLAGRICRMVGRKRAGQGGKMGMGLVEGTDRGLSFLAARSRGKDALSS